jgi:ATP:ADP antiporter, AAA family
VTTRTLTRIAMTSAGIMLAHQVAAKALRDATFLTAWPATALPLMTVATAVLTVVLVPLVSRLFERYSTRAVVAAGFLVSAAGHLVEWASYDTGRLIAVVIYLHVAGVTALLLSGFWSLISERFDPAGARAAYGRIAAAGTAGGIFGTFIAARIATTEGSAAVLLFLAGLHVLCSGGVALMRGAPALLPAPDGGGDRMSGVAETLRAPYVRTIAWFVLLTSASSAIIDFVWKSNASASFGTGPDLLRYFALFYGSIQVLSFIAQTQAGRVLQGLGVSGTLNVLPAGVGAAGMIALIAPGWAAITGLRGIDAVVRNSLFRSGYELLFVPMDARTRNRAKAVLDVICDRVGEAAGSAVVQLALLAGMASTGNILLAVSIVLAILAWRMGMQFGHLYLDVVERELVKYYDRPQVSLVSEAGWTLLQVPGPLVTEASAEIPAASVPESPALHLDSQLQTLADLRSRDMARIAPALGRPSALGRMHVAQIIDLLAWDEALPAARAALEQLAPSHLGMLIDAMLDPGADFILRRRLPRILGTVATERSVRGLIDGLDDSRFEVRYHCSRAIDRISAKNPGLPFDRARIISVIERELAVPPQRWRGYHLLDRPEPESAGERESSEDQPRHLEHIFQLLTTIVSREPLDAAVHGVRSPDPGVRGLALEYLDQVLPPAILQRLRELIASTPSGGDAPSQSAEPPTARQSSEEH